MKNDVEVMALTQLQMPPYQDYRLSACYYTSNRQKRLPKKSDRSYQH